MLDRYLTVAVALAALSMSVAGAQAHDEAKYPDWSGQWYRNYPGPPRYDPSKPLRKLRGVPWSKRMSISGRQCTRRSRRRQL